MFEEVGACGAGGREDEREQRVETEAQRTDYVAGDSSTRSAFPQRRSRP